MICGRGRALLFEEKAEENVTTNSFLFIVLIWVAVYICTSVADNIDDNYNYEAPQIIKILGNPFFTDRIIILSMGLVRIFNNIFLIVGFVGRIIFRNDDDYWGMYGANYLAGIIVVTCLSIVVEELFVCKRKIKEEESIASNVALMCFFGFGIILLSIVTMLYIQ